MKRLFCVLLSFALLLSIAGCAQQTPPADTAPVNGGDARFRLTELPDVGAYAPDEKIGFFFDDGPHDSFEPREDYGRILPYIAECRDYETPEYETYTDYETGELVTYKNEIRFTAAYAAYGLMTADGRIITTGLWDEAEAIGTSEGGYYALYNVNEDFEGRNYYKAVDYVAFDGSWALHTAGENIIYMSNKIKAPWLPIFEDGILTLYDMKGQPRGRCRSALGGKTTETRTEGIDILYADAQKVVVMDTVYDYNGSNDSFTAATLSADGEIQHSFNAEGHLSCPAGTVFIYDGGDAGKTVFNADGQRLDGYSYLDVIYSEADRLYLTLRTVNGAYTAEYRDENWAPAYPEKANWTQYDPIYITSSAEIRTKNGIYLQNWEYDTLTDFYGNRIQLQTKTGYYDDITIRDDPAAGTACSIAYETDGSVSICKMDGTLLTTVAAEDTGGEDRIEISLHGDILAYLTEHDVHLINVSTGKNLGSMHIDFFDKLDADAENALESVYFGEFDDSYISFYYHWLPRDAMGYEAPGDLCIIKNGADDAIPILTCDQVNDIWLIATDEYSYVYNNDGSVLLKIPTNLYA